MSAVAERPITITAAPRRQQPRRMRAPWRSATCVGLGMLEGRYARASVRDPIGGVLAPACRQCRRTEPMPSVRTVRVDAASTGITRTKRFSDTSRERLAAIRCRSRPSHSSCGAPTRVQEDTRHPAFKSAKLRLKSGDTRYNKSEQVRETEAEGRSRCS